METCDGGGVEERYDVLRFEGLGLKDIKYDE